MKYERRLCGRQFAKIAIVFVYYYLFFILVRLIYYIIHYSLYYTLEADANYDNRSYKILSRIHSANKIDIRLL